MTTDAQAIPFEDQLTRLVGKSFYYYNPVGAWELVTLLSFARNPRMGLLGTLRQESDGEQVERPLKPEAIYQHTPGIERHDPDNLLALPELHHSILINVLKLRHAKDNVYTYLGDLVIALNPFKYSIPWYADPVMNEYSNYLGQAEIPFSAATTAGPYSSFLRPHPWAVAHRAYVEMLQTNKKNHSIVISGESGAGKTETCKLLLKYLVHAASRKLRDEFLFASNSRNESAASPTFNGSPLMPSPGSFRGVPISTQDEMWLSNQSFAGSPSFGALNMTTLITEESLKQREEHAATINQRVQQANPILEAFGNAKTARNDNSSRFGKFMEVQFDDVGSLMGMRVTPFLLEKSRVIHCGSDERCYHSFYQLLAGGSPALLSSLRLKRAKDYPNLDRGGCLIIRGVDDAKEFQAVVQAMTDVGMTEKERDAIWRVLASVLHLQSIEFQEHRVTSAAELTLEGKGACDFVASDLLGLQQPSILAECLVTNVTYVRQERIVKALNVQRAKDQRDSLCKHLYAKLFYWIVQRINEATMANTLSATSWIGLLDIFGFEDMTVNSFEQLCINLTNEVLQRNYTRAIFDKDLEDMRGEGVSVEAVKFRDNAQCIELLQGPRNSILSFLDDSSTLDFERSQTNPNLTFLSRVTAQHRPDFQTAPPPKGTKSVLDREEGGKSPSDYFFRGRLDDDTFTIKHYAGDVKYKVHGFVEKNIDVLKESTQVALLTSTDELIKQVLTIEEDSIGLLSGGLDGSSSPRTMSLQTGSPGGGGGGIKKTASATFRKSLSLLKDLLAMSATHWVRCMRPHHRRQPGLFDGKCMLEQLVATGVLETVAQRQRNFPFRLRHFEFLDRFAVISFAALRRSRARMSHADKCNAVLVTAHIKGDKEAQVGTSKVFLSADARQSLEARRTDSLNAFVVTLQRYSNHYLSKQIANYLLTRKVTVFVQRRYLTKLRIRRAVKAYYEAIWQRITDEMAAVRRDLYIKETKGRTLVEAAMVRKHEDTFAMFRKQLVPLVAAVLVNIQLVESQKRISEENTSRDDRRSIEQAFVAERITAANRVEQRLQREEVERVAARQFLLDIFNEGHALIKDDEQAERAILTASILPLKQRIDRDAASVGEQMAQRDAMLKVLEAERISELKRIEKARKERIAAEEDLWIEHIGSDAHRKDLAFLATNAGLNAEQCREHMTTFYATRAATAVVGGSVMSPNMKGASLPTTISSPYRQGIGAVSSFREYATFMKDAYDRHATHATPHRKALATATTSTSFGQDDSCYSPEFDEAVMSSRPLEEVAKQREQRYREEVLYSRLKVEQEVELKRQSALQHSYEDPFGDVGRLMMDEHADGKAGGISISRAATHHMQSHSNFKGQNQRVNVDAFCGAWTAQTMPQQSLTPSRYHPPQTVAPSPINPYSVRNGMASSPLPRFRIGSSPQPSITTPVMRSPAYLSGHRMAASASPAPVHRTEPASANYYLHPNTTATRVAVPDDDDFDETLF